MVRRITPVTERCQPPSSVTRGARPPPPPPPGPLPRAAGGAERRRAGAAAARGSTAPPLRPRRHPPPRPPSPLPATPAPRPPSPRRRRAGCAGASTVCGACRRRLRAQTESPPARRRRYPAGTPRTRSLPPGRSFTRLGVVGGGDEGRARRRMRIEGRLDVFVRGLARALHAQFLEQERERPLEIGPDGRPHVLWEIPHAPLVGADHLLAALVDELLLGVALLPLVLALGFHPGVQLGAQVGGELGMIEHEILEVRGEVNLHRL